MASCIYVYILHRCTIVVGNKENPRNEWLKNEEQDSGWEGLAQGQYDCHIILNYMKALKGRL